MPTLLIVFFLTFIVTIVGCFDGATSPQSNDASTAICSIPNVPITSDTSECDSCHNSIQNSHCPLYQDSIWIEGLPKVGEVLTGHYIFTNRDDNILPSPKIQWIRDGQIIPEATNTTYTLTAEDLGASIFFQITPITQSTNPSNITMLFSDMIIVNLGYLPEAKNVAILGTPTENSTLTASYTYFDPDGDPEGESYFQWFRNEDTITGATEQTYTITHADSGSIVSVSVTPVSAVSPNTGNSVKKAHLKTTGGFRHPYAAHVKVKGSLFQGSTISGEYLFGDLDGDLEGASTYRWFRNGNPIDGATGIEYTISYIDSGKTLTFEVTPIALTGIHLIGTPKVSGDSPLVYGFTNPSALDVHITGIFKQEEILTGVYTYYDSERDLEGETTYQWYRNGTAILDATNRTYPLGVGDKGSSISFRVFAVAQTGVNLQGHTGYSAASPKVQGFTPPTLLFPTTAGTTKLGDTLTAQYFYTDEEGDPEGATLYRWYRNYSFIEGATEKTYTITIDDIGCDLYVEIVPVALTGSVTMGDTIRSPIKSIWNIQTCDYSENDKSLQCLEKKYKTTTIGSQVWMAENLNFWSIFNSDCYNDSIPNCVTFGRLYSWDAAIAGGVLHDTLDTHIQGICPVGWHLPSNEEWGELAQFVATTENLTDTLSGAWTQLGPILKDTLGWADGATGTNNYGFSGIAAGYANYHGKYVGDIDRSIWWSATGINGSNVYGWRLSANDDYFRHAAYNVHEKQYSVRCIKND